MPITAPSFGKPAPNPFTPAPAPKPAPAIPSGPISKPTPSLPGVPAPKPVPFLPPQTYYGGGGGGGGGVTPTAPPISTALPTGTPVGSAVGGGTLVVTPGAPGGVSVVPMSTQIKPAVSVQVTPVQQYATASPYIQPPTILPKQITAVPENIQFMKLTPFQQFYTSDIVTKIKKGLGELLPEGFQRAEQPVSPIITITKPSITGTRATQVYEQRFRTAEELPLTQAYQMGLYNEKQFLEAEAKYQAAATFGTGVVLGAVSILAPPVGVAAGILYGAKTILDLPEIIKTTTISPKATAISIGAGLAGGAVGALGTAYIVPKIKGELASIGRQEIQIEKLSSQKPYPEAPVEKHLEIFKENKYALPGEESPGVYHATPYGGSFKETFTVTPGSSELPGLYVAPEVSYKFLKIQGVEIPVPKFFDLSTTSVLEKAPKILRIYPEAIEEAPTFGEILLPKKSAVIIERFKTRGPESTKFLLTKAEKGVAYVPGVKTEIEAIIPPESTFALSGQKFYTEFIGIKVPIDQYISSAEKGVISASELEGGYIPTFSITTPGTIGYGISRVKYVPSKISYPSNVSKIVSQVSSVPSKSIASVSKVSYPTISYPSITTSSITTYPSISYLPIVPPSYVVPYVPPKYPITYSPITPKIITPKIIPPFKSLDEEKRFKFGERKRRKAYSVFLRRRGKYIPVAIGLPRERALKFGSEKALGTLGRTFKIKAMGETFQEDIAFKPREDIFRTFKVRKGIKQPLVDTYIQRASKSLSTRAERGLIREARIEKQSGIKNPFRYKQKIFI